MAKREVRFQPPQMFLLQLLVILAQWASGFWLLPVLRTPPSPTPIGWALFLPCAVAFLLGKMWMFKFFAKHGASPMFKKHAGALDPLLLHGPPPNAVGAADHAGAMCYGRVFEFSPKNAFIDAPGNTANIMAPMTERWRES